MGTRRVVVHAPDPLEAALQPRVSKGLVACDVRDLRRERHAIRARYAGGLPAEKQSRDELLRAKRRAVRLTILRRRGRPIDLAALLKERRKDGLPVWALVDPRRQIGDINGRVDPDGERYVAAGQDGYVKIAGTLNSAAGQRFAPAGMPVLPGRVRELIAGLAQIERQAGGGLKRPRRVRWLGVLYQPEQWIELRPDPALVVEYEDLPGEFFALAVWGGDRARIMEFVD